MIVSVVSLVMYERMGVSNADITLYTGWLYLPWVIKPLWSPLVEIFKTKREWIIIMQLLIGAGLAGVAFSIPAPMFFRTTMIFFWLMAFSSATHDIAVDGFYMISLTEFQQSYFIGIRNTFYRIGMIAAQGLLVMIGGRLEKVTGDVPFAWSITFGAAAGLFVLFGIYHRFVLPRPETTATVAKRGFGEIMGEFFGTFAAFFRKKGIVAAIAFLLLYRLGEVQLTKMTTLFLLNKRGDGGLGLDPEVVGLSYGTFGVIALIAGGIAGGIAISRRGLKYWLLPMMFAINLPDVVYVYLSYTQPENLLLINAAIIIEQFGYGFGFTAYTLFMIYLSDGMYKTAHYAICTAFMALGKMLPEMAAGRLQQYFGYEHFFIWVMVCTVPAFFLLPLLRIDRGFGMKNKKAGL